MIDRLTDMAIFAEVVESGSFTQAAERMELSKGAVSKAVTRLETHLQVKLLLRTTRSLVPTTEGMDFYKHCREIVKEAMLAEEHIGAMHSTPSGRVVISAPVNFGATQIAPWTPDLLTRYPELEIDLQLTNRTVDLVGEKVDIAVRCGPLKNSNLYYRKVKPLEIVLVATPEYFQKHGKPSHPKDLSYEKRKHQCVAQGTKSADRTWRFYRGNELIEVRVDGRFSVGENRAVRTALVNHLGMAFMPRYSLEGLIREGVLETALEDFMPQPVPISLLYPERKYTSSAVSATLDFLEAKLTGGMSPEAGADDCRDKQRLAG